MCTADGCAATGTAAASGLVLLLLVRARGGCRCGSRGLDEVGEDGGGGGGLVGRGVRVWEEELGIPACHS